MVNVRAPLMLLLLLLGSFLFRLWNMSPVFNACRMHSLPLTTECSALAREKERASQRDSDCALERDSRRKRRAARSILMFAIKCLWDCISPTQFLIFLSVFFTFVTNALDTHSWAHIRTDETFFDIMHMDVIIKVLRTLRHCYDLRTELKRTWTMKKMTINPDINDTFWMHKVLQYCINTSVNLFRLFLN